MVYPWHLYTFAFIFIVSGNLHFMKPKMYMRIMPRYLPNHKLLVHISGLVEIILGITICIPVLKNLTIYGIIAMLSVFLLVHFYMLSGKKASIGIPKWILILRIPLQFFLIYWAYSLLQY